MSEAAFYEEAGEIALLKARKYAVPFMPKAGLVKVPMSIMPGSTAAKRWLRTAERSYGGSIPSRVQQHRNRHAKRIRGMRQEIRSPEYKEVEAEYGRGADPLGYKSTLRGYRNNMRYNRGAEEI